MKAAGIDLAGVESRSTGFCLMEGDLKAQAELLYTDDQIISETVASNPEVVAVDAPLSLPLGRESLEVRSNIHLREADRELLRMKIKFFPISLGPMRLLADRGIRLKNKLEKMGLKVIETYPGGAQDILGIPRKNKGLEKLTEGLRNAGVQGLKDGLSGDELDAVTCALVGIMYLQDRYLAIGNPAEGLMYLPARSYIIKPNGN